MLYNLSCKLRELIRKLIVDQTKAAYNRTKDLYFFQFLLQAESNIGKRRKGINAVSSRMIGREKRGSNEKTSSGDDG